MPTMVIINFTMSSNIKETGTFSGNPTFIYITRGNYIQSVSFSEMSICCIN